MRPFLRFVLPLATLVALVTFDHAPLGAQSVQYTSVDGTRYTSLRDTGDVARAEQEYRRIPSIENAIALGTAQASVRQFREAIETFSAALRRDPNDARLLRWRGHRYLTMRDLGRAKRDLERSTLLDSTLYGAWYHLGIVHFVLNEPEPAVRAFSRALSLAPDAGERAGSVDWLWMSLMDARRPDAAAALLARRPDSVVVDNAYARRLRLYRGEIAADAVVTAADTSDVQASTLAFGVANWHRLRGDSASAATWYRRAIAARGWPGFGFIASERALERYGRADFWRTPSLRACIDRQPITTFPRATANLEIPPMDGDVAPRAARQILEAVDVLVTRAGRDLRREIAGRDGVTGAADSLLRHDELDGQAFIVIHRDGRVVVKAEQAIGLDDPRRFHAIGLVHERLRAILDREPPSITWPESLRTDSLVVPMSIVREDPSARGGRGARRESRVSVPLFSIHAPAEKALAVKPESPAPEYPPAAVRARLQATVVLRFIVDTSGRIDLTTVRDVFEVDARSARRPLDEEVYEAFRNEVVAILPATRFEPASIGGCAVPQLVQLPFRFQLQR